MHLATIALAKAVHAQVWHEPGRAITTNRTIGRRRYLPFFSTMDGQFASAFFKFPSASSLKPSRTPRLY